MKIAIVHDHFLYLGGAERVLLTLLKMYRHADVYLAFATADNIALLAKYTTGAIMVSPFDSAPPANRLTDWFKPILYLWWRSLDLSRYDLVISSSHSFSAKSVTTRRPTVHLAYIHTPPRYLYGEYNESQWLRRWPVCWLVAPVLAWVRRQDFIAAQRPDILIANSKTVQRRIKKYYQRDSVVVYPPVQIPRRLSKQKNPTYYLVVSRLVKQKGVDLAIAVCNRLRLPLVIVGVGKEFARLKKIAGPTVSFRGFVPDEDMGEVYAKARALLYCSREEDFGMVPVEAMAHGVPVVASGDGGATESVIHGRTGILFRGFEIQDVMSALHEFDRSTFAPGACRRRANAFSENIFKKKFASLLTSLLPQNA